jgi:transcriptional regulator with XRE-family HTH domain
MNKIIEVETELATWLVKELDNRGWSQRELGRRAGIAGATVSRVIAGDQNPGWDFCLAIAKAFGEEPMTVFDMAGLLEKPASKTSPQPETDAMIYEIWRAWKAAPATPSDASPVALPPDQATPRLEDIMNIIEQLDHYGLRMVYDFTRWQAEEQNRRRDSSGRRRTSKERQKEEKEVIQLIDLMLAVDEATPTARELFIVYLIKTYVSRWGDCPEELMNILPPLIRQSLPPDLGCSSQSDT